jgi:hypothetical protein
MELERLAGVGVEGERNETVGGRGMELWNRSRIFGLVAARWGSNAKSDVS